MIALAINLVVAILGYYAIMMWGLFRGWRKLWREIANPSRAAFARGKAAILKPNLMGIGGLQSNIRIVPICGTPPCDYGLSLSSPLKLRPFLSRASPCISSLRDSAVFGVQSPILDFGSRFDCCGRGGLWRVEGLTVQQVNEGSPARWALVRRDNLVPPGRLGCVIFGAPRAVWTTRCRPQSGRSRGMSHNRAWPLGHVRKYAISRRSAPVPRQRPQEGELWGAWPSREYAPRLARLPARKYATIELTHGRLARQPCHQLRSFGLLYAVFRLNALLWRWRPTWMWHSRS